MNTSILQSAKETVVKEIENFLKQNNISYTPQTYYYTPLTIRPRSMTPLIENQSFEFLKDLENFQLMTYVHIPLCTRRCTFCPFQLDIGKNIPEIYIDALLKHAQMIRNIIKLPKKVNFYFGGGSPNLLSTVQVKRLVEGLEIIFGKAEEISMELHPEVCATENYLESLQQIGIHRVSFGLQSTSPRILQMTARMHEGHTLDNAIAKARSIGLKTNIDIMHGGFYRETMKDNENAFNHAFSLKPDWVTGYQMCIQEGTQEYLRYQRETDFYPTTEEILKSKEFLYKIAAKHGYSFVSRGFFSKEGVVPIYQRKWSEKTAVLALGSGSYSYTTNLENSALWWSPFDTDKYIKMVTAGIPPIERMDSYSLEERESWNTISALKESNADLRLGYSTEIKLKLEKLLSLGFLKKDDGILSLSSKGELIEDLVYASLIPTSTWYEFSLRRQEQDYLESEEARYDWFFEPDAVLNFIHALK